MKKLVLVLIALVLAVPCFASQETKEIIDTTLTKTSPAIEADTYIGDAEKVTFFVTYDSSRTTAAVTAVVTAAVSLDGTHWQDISWMDVAGGVTPQTTETLSLDGTYVGRLESNLTAPMMRIRVTLPNYAKYGSGETAGVTVTVVEKK